MQSSVAAPAADRPARAASRLGMAMDSARRFLFGHDVFISYARADALEYAQELADALTKHRLATYVDQLGTPPGPVIPPLLLLRLRLSGMLVLIGSPRAAASKAVAQEVETFVRGNHRLFVVDVEGALDGTEWYHARIKGGPARRITRDELAGGVPSQAVVEQILKNVDFARREDRLRRTMRYTLAGIGTLLVLGAAGAMVLNAKAAEASRRLAAAAATVDSLGHVGAALDLANRATAERSDLSTEGLVRSLLLSTESLREAWTLDGAGAWLRALSQLAPPLGEVRGHTAALTAVAASADGRRLASGGQDGLVRVWDVREGGGRVALAPHGPALALQGQRHVTALAFSPDRRMLATAFGRRLVVWSLDGARPAPRLVRPLTNTAHALAFSPDGRTLAVAETYRLRLVETEGWRDTLLGETGERARLRVAFSPDGQWMAVGGSQAELWSVRERRLAAVGPRSFLQVAFEPGGQAVVADGRRLALRDSTGAVALVPASASQALGYGVHALSRDGRHVLTNQFGPALATLDGRDLARIPVEVRFSTGRSVVAFGPADRWVAVGTEDGRLTLWPGSPRNASVLIPGREAAASLSFSRDGRWLAVASASGVLRVFRTRPWAQVFRDSSSATSARFTPDGRWLLAVGDTVVRPYRPGDWVRMPDLSHEARLEGVWVSPDGTQLATRAEAEFIRGLGLARPTRMRVWDVTSGRELGWRWEYEYDRRRGRYRNRDEDTTAPAEGGRDDLARQAVNWRPVPSEPDSAPGGLGARRESRTAAVVDGATGRTVVEIDPAQGTISDAEVSPDGTWLATAGEDGTVRLWRLRGAREMIAEACGRVPRNLTRAEWERLFAGRPYRRICPALPNPLDLATPPDSAQDEADG